MGLGTIVTTSHIDVSGLADLCFGSLFAQWGLIFRYALEPIFCFATIARQYSVIASQARQGLRRVKRIRPTLTLDYGMSRSNGFTMRLKTPNLRAI
ncbi:MAG: hypothetical protein ACI9XZ_002917 [Alphaproteobacteria bacterium]|jgi:hypothetical protein